MHATNHSQLEIMSIFNTNAVFQERAAKAGMYVSMYACIKFINCPSHFEAILSSLQHKTELRRRQSELWYQVRPTNSRHAVAHSL